MDEIVATIADELKGLEVGVIEVVDCLRDFDREAASLDDDINAYRKDISGIEAETADEVATEVDGEGKAVYSNADRRKAETANRLGKSDEYQKLVKNAGEAERKRRELQLKAADFGRRLAQRRDVQANRRALLYALAGTR